MANFDLYLFALSWQPHFCCQNPKKCKPQDLQKSFHPHGLWPSYGDENYQRAKATRGQQKGPDGNPLDPHGPTFCPVAPEAAVKPNAAPTGSKMETGRQKHEWEKHGVCSGLTRAVYGTMEQMMFEHSSEVQNLKKVLQPKASSANAMNVVTVSDVYIAAGGNDRVAIKTSETCQLEEITLCLSKRLDGSSDRCPRHVLEGMRNSGISRFKCQKIVVDKIGVSSPELCSTVTKSLLDILKKK